MFRHYNKFLLISILFGISITTVSTTCGQWTAYKDEKCFKIFDNVAPEATAETICKEKDNTSVLVIIRTEEEQDFIEKYLNGSKIEDNVWIGIKKTNNSFKWLDGTDVKYTNWDKERPLKDSTDENCVDISVERKNFGKWIDSKCGKKNSILCEKIQPWSVPRLQNILLEERRNNKVLLDSQKNEISDLKSELIILKSKTRIIPDQQKALDSYKIELDKQQKLIDLHKAELNKLISNPVPIGFIYVQLSGQSEPNTLWPNTQWDNISTKYSGLFFRAEGEQSFSFGQIQDQQTQSFELFSAEVGKSFWWREWTKITEKSSDKFMITGADSSNRTLYIGIKFIHNKEEIRPRNQAIRIWQRTK